MLLDARIVVIRTADLAKARRWYSTVLRFPPRRAGHDAVIFDAGNYEIRLVKGRRGTFPATAVSVYWRVHNLENALRHFLRCGAVLHSSAAECETVGTCATIIDPFGNLIGLVEEACASPC